MLTGVVFDHNEINIFSCYLINKEENWKSLATLNKTSVVLFC